MHAYMHMDILNSRIHKEQFRVHWQLSEVQIIDRGSIYLKHNLIFLLIKFKIVSNYKNN